MGHAFLYGNGGGNQLRIKVLSGTTAPSNQKEYTIWVKSSVAVSGWEMGISQNPTWKMKAGFVYLYTNTAAYNGSTTFNPLKKNFIYIAANYVWQNQGTYDSPEWVQCEAYLYKGGSWVKIATTFSATIKVTYPSGSTLTCINGSTTLTATTTTGSYTFTVHSAGTWTVKAVSGNNSASQSVSITTSGQSASVTLTYFDGYLLKNGVWSSYACPNGITGGFNLDRITKETYDGTVVLRLKSQCRAFSADKIAVSKYTKLNATIHNIYGATFTLALASTQDDSSAVASTTSTTTGNISLDISSITSASYLMISSISGSTDDGQGTRITNIWLS